jgi:hypothetical protein
MHDPRRSLKGIWILQKRHPNLSMKGIWNFHLAHKQTKGKERPPTLNDLTIVSIEIPQSPLAQRYDAPIIFLPDTLLIFVSVTDVYGQKIRCLYSDQNHPPSVLCAFRLTWLRQAPRLITPVFNLRSVHRKENLFSKEPKFHQSPPYVQFI